MLRKGVIVVNESEQISIIKENISGKIFLLFKENNIKYSLEKENKKLEKTANKNNEKFSLRVIALMNVFEKLVPIRKSKVWISDILEQKIIRKDFSEELISKINEFIVYFEQGESINSNLSRNTFNSDSWDYILNAWNIRHLHLSWRTEFDDASMKKNRADYLLFFIFDDDNVYFIDVKEHPKGSGFSKFEFLETIERNNWIHCTPFKIIEGVIDMQPVITSNEDIYTCMKNSINVSFKINNKFYIPILGIASSGNKMNHTQYLIDINKKINMFSNQAFKFLDFQLVMKNDIFGYIFFEKDNKKSVIEL